MGARTILFALSALLASLPAGAMTRWFCSYAPSEGEAILCQLLEADPAGAKMAMPLPAGYQRLPKVVSDIHQAPETLDARTIVIPVHGIPFEMGRAAQLARAIMCAGKPGCEVIFKAERQGPVQAVHVGVPPPGRRPIFSPARRSATVPASTSPR